MKLRICNIIVKTRKRVNFGSTEATIRFTGAFLKALKAKEDIYFDFDMAALCYSGPI